MKDGKKNRRKKMMKEGRRKEGVAAVFITLEEVEVVQGRDTRNLPPIS